MLWLVFLDNNFTTYLNTINYIIINNDLKTQCQLPVWQHFKNNLSPLFSNIYTWKHKTQPTPHSSNSPPQTACKKACTMCCLTTSTKKIWYCPITSRPLSKTFIFSWPICKKRKNSSCLRAISEIKFHKKQSFLTLQGLHVTK